MSATTTPKILVVDDNEANRALAQGTFEDEGFEVILADGGYAGLAAYERERPDCVLLDIRMPDIDGLSVCKRIRAMPGGAETPVLFLTALRDVDTFDRAVHASGDDFLTKPIRPTELLLRVRTALKLRRMGAELREQYDLFKQQRDAMLRLQLQKERLMAFIVHDLKNPVNSMDLHAQLLLRAKNLPEAARESATQIRSEARQLTRLILNLLDIAKADEGQLAPRRSKVRLVDLLEDVFSELRATAENRKVTLVKACAVDHVGGDPDLLRRTITNIVENATRYAPPDSEIVVSAAVVDGGIELRVSDSGPGVPAAMREKIFDPFVQVEAGESPVSRNSRGLGLSFCKSAIEAHGGKIWIEDNAPGTVFCILLPDAS